jgi:hypothetical protein
LQLNFLHRDLLDLREPVPHDGDLEGHVIGGRSVGLISSQTHNAPREGWEVFSDGLERFDRCLSRREVQHLHIEHSGIGRRESHHDIAIACRGTTSDRILDIATRPNDGRVTDTPSHLKREVR